MSHVRFKVTVAIEALGPEGETLAQATSTITTGTTLDLGAEVKPHTVRSHADDVIPDALDEACVVVASELRHHALSAAP